MVFSCFSTPTSRESEKKNCHPFEHKGNARSNTSYSFCEQASDESRGGSSGMALSEELPHYCRTVGSGFVKSILQCNLDSLLGCGSSFGRPFLLEDKRRSAVELQ